MSRQKGGGGRNGGTCRELVEYRHSYHCFLSKYLPQYLPPPSNVPPPPPPPLTPSRSPTSTDIDLRLLNLDARNWKKQDHYLLLGLHEKRHLASQAEIKAAYRQRVLQYHPDKLQQSSSPTENDEPLVEDNIFKCIFHAYQVLSDTEKRKLYDSVDANAFDDSIPAEDAVPVGDVEAFIGLYRPVFIKNGRFSRKQPVPDIGQAFSPREEVEAFYAFWSTFESWRTFDYLDEDESENPENRADKRWLEKKNKASRAKRKNDDNARLRRLFEQAYKLDPRVLRFKEDDKLRKNAIKMEKEMAAMKIAQEKEDARRKQEEEERLERERILQAELEAKKRREAIELQLRRVKKEFKKIFVDHLYFVSDKLNIIQINERSLLVEKYILKEANLETSLNRINDLFQSGEREGLYHWIESEYKCKYSPPEVLPLVTNKKATQPIISADTANSQYAWTIAEIDTLINAIKTHPGGMRERWERITEWYNRHVQHMDKTLPIRTTEELIKQANDIRQTTDEGQVGSVISVDAQTDYKALQKKRDPRIDQAEPTMVFDGNNNQSSWSMEEQKKLQEGLKTHKADDPARWEKIANLVGRSKKDCMLRAKEIAQMLKQKKATIL